jgi:hypothetical protein
LYILIFAFRHEMGNQKILNWMKTSIYLKLWLSG